MSMRKAGDSGARAALAELLTWEEIERSPQLAKFLRYVVEAKLAGDEQKIKAYAIAVDVFGRPATFDPQQDPIVRVQARRLRHLLDRYYASGLAKTPLRIRLPVGRYVPEFEPLSLIAVDATTARNEVTVDAVPDSGDRGNAGAISPSVNASAPVADLMAPRRQRIGSLVVAVAGVALLAVILAVLVLGRGWLTPPEAPALVPSPPIVFVGSFSNLTGLPVFDDMAGRLKTAVATMLSAFPDLKIATADNARPPPQSALFLTGLIRRTDTGVEIGMMLANQVGGSASWDTSIVEPLQNDNPGRVVAEVARLLVSRVATFRGPLYTAGRGWLAQQRQLEDAPSLYGCLLRFRVAGENGGASSGEARACFDRHLALRPDSAPALAGQAWLMARAALAEAQAGDNPAVLLQPAVVIAGRAKALAPGDAFATGMLARVLDLAGSRRAARQAFVESLGMNPADLDIRAAYAVSLALGGEWDAAAVEADAALHTAPPPPAWYHFVPSLDAYRRGDYPRALDEALLLATSGSDVASALVVAAGARAGRQDMVQRFLPAVLTNAAYRRQGILARIGITVTDPALLDAIGDGLGLAGVPQADMRRPF